MSLFEEPQKTNPVEALVGEGKKYKTVDDLAASRIEADNFIEQLKRENAELRQRPVVDRTQEILDRMEALRNEPVTQIQPQPVVTERTEVKGLSEEDVLRLMDERSKKARGDANVNLVKQELQKKYGDKYPQALKSMAEKNGLGTKFLDQMAAESPQALLNLMGSEKHETLFTPPVSVVQPGNEKFTPTSGNPRTEAYYENLKITDRKLYNSKPVQDQMMKDAIALNMAFYDK